VYYVEYSVLFFTSDVYIILGDDNLHKLQTPSSFWKVSAGMLHYLQSFIRKWKLPYLHVRTSWCTCNAM